MTEISIGDAVGAGFRVIRHRPLPVLLWGALTMAMILVSLALLAPMYSALFTQIRQNAASGHATPATLTGATQMQGVNYLLNFIQLFVSTVVNCAIFRSVVHPERDAFGYLRVGGTELLLFAMVVAEIIAFIVAAIVVILPGALIVGVLVALHAGGFAVVVGLLLGFAAAYAGIYVALRFSMMGPMMVDDDKVHFLDAWTLTRGKAGNLFMIALCVIAILLVAETVVVLVGVIVGFSAMSGIAGGMQAIPALFKQSPEAIFAQLTPLLIVGGLIAIPLYGAILTIIGAPWARAYLDLRHNPAEAF
jgi:hypothetical protein